MKQYRLTNKNFLDKKVPFIKELRTAFGLGLKEAKEIADQLYMSDDEHQGIFAIPLDIKDDQSFARLAWVEGSYRRQLLKITIDAINFDDTTIAESILNFVNNNKLL